MSPRNAKFLSMPRPKFRADQVTLSERLSSIVAPDEMELLRSAAADAGLTVSSYVRLAAVGTASASPTAQQKILTAGAAIP